MFKQQFVLVSAIALISSQFCHTSDHPAFPFKIAAIGTSITALGALFRKPPKQPSIEAFKPPSQNNSTTLEQFHKHPLPQPTENEQEKHLSKKLLPKNRKPHGGPSKGALRRGQAGHR